MGDYQFYKEEKGMTIREELEDYISKNLRDTGEWVRSVDGIMEIINARVDALKIRVSEIFSVDFDQLMEELSEGRTSASAEGQTLALEMGRIKSDEPNPFCPGCMREKIDPPDPLCNGCLNGYDYEPAPREAARIARLVADYLLNNVDSVAADEDISDDVIVDELTPIIEAALRERVGSEDAESATEDGLAAMTARHIREPKDMTVRPETAKLPREDAPATDRRRLDGSPPRPCPGDEACLDREHELSAIGGIVPKAGASPTQLRRIYVASSWKNEAQPRIVRLLRGAGHEVYDFRHPTEAGDGFSWAEIEREWAAWSPGQFLAALDHPAAVRGFQHDFEALQNADTGVLVLPCGKSAHLEAGYFAGSGKRLFILMQGQDTPELMYKLATKVCTSEEELLAEIEGKGE